MRVSLSLILTAPALEKRFVTLATRIERPRRERFGTWYQEIVRRPATGAVNENEYPPFLISAEIVAVFPSGASCSSSAVFSWARVGTRLPIIALPNRSTATHSDTEGHARPTMLLLPSMCAPVHELAPPAGFAEENASPLPSTIAHNLADAHATCKPKPPLDAPIPNRFQA